jgi:hypothetical protein
VAQNQSGRRSAIDGHTIRDPGYAVSQRIRKRVEEAFGWARTVAGLRKRRHRGLPKIGWQFTLAMAAYNLAGLPKLLIEPSHDQPSPLDERPVLPPPPKPGWRLVSTAARPKWLPRKHTSRRRISHFSVTC